MLPWNDGPGPCLTYRYGALHSVMSPSCSERRSLIDNGTQWARPLVAQRAFSSPVALPGEVFAGWSSLSSRLVPPKSQLSSKPQ